MNWLYITESFVSISIEYTCIQTQIFNIYRTKNSNKKIIPLLKISDAKKFGLHKISDVNIFGLCQCPKLKTSEIFAVNVISDNNIIIIIMHMDTVFYTYLHCFLCIKPAISTKNITAIVFVYNSTSYHCRAPINNK